MKIDNKKKIFQIWLFKLVNTSIFIVLIVIIGYFDFFNNPVLGINRTTYLVFLNVIYVGLFIYNYRKKPNYIYFSDSGDKIVLRYYDVRIFNNKKNSIEILKQNFYFWETEKFLFGSYEMLYLHGKFKSGIAKYPGVSLSALNDKDREKLKSALNVHAKKKFIERSALDN
jgi:hypothetical protein